MKQKLLLVLICPGCLILVCFGLRFSLTDPHHNITKGGFHCVKEGMTEKEVESIFGVPAGDYEITKRMPLPTRDLYMPTVPCETKEWLGNGQIITIWFDNGGIVLHKRLVGWSPETFLDKLRRYLDI